MLFVSLIITLALCALLSGRLALPDSVSGKAGKTSVRASVDGKPVDSYIKE